MRLSAGLLLRAAVLVALVGVTAAVALGFEPADPAPTPTPAVGGPAVLVGAGDIVECRGDGDEATAALVESIAGTVFTLGDNVYPKGAPEGFRDCYDPSWGRFRDRTRPASGNHDYGTQDAAGYFGYFGERAGRPGEGWYSYDLGGWHVVVLNSECHRVGGCDAGSPQMAWLRDDLAANDAACTVAMWHKSRFSSGRYGDDADFEPFWQALYEDGADVVLTGHDHHYERLLPQTPGGERDDERGIRAFVVGTGGTNLRTTRRLSANSEVRIDDRHGVLVLVLEPDGYRWEFRTTPDGEVADHGVGRCH